MPTVRTFMPRTYATYQDLIDSGDTHSMVWIETTGLPGSRPILVVRVGSVWRPGPGQVLGGELSLTGLTMEGGGTSMTTLTVGALTQLFKTPMIPDWLWPDNNALVMGLAAGIANASVTTTADIYGIICSTQPTSTTATDYPMALSQAMSAGNTKGFDPSLTRWIARSGATLYRSGGAATPVQTGLAQIFPSFTVPAPANWQTGTARFRVYGKAGATSDVYRVYGWFLKSPEISA